MTTHEPPKTMTAVVSTADDQRIERRDVDVPIPGPGQVLIRVRAFSLNRGELALLAHRPAGWGPGQDIAGDIVSVGPGSGALQIGQRVAALVDSAGWAEYAVAPADRTALIPDNVTFEHAAALPMAGTTALGLIEQGGALLGKRALVTGASGGVGGLAVQLLAMSGARVTALARTSQAQRLLELGATAVIGSLDDLIDPVDLVLESVGGDTLAKAVRTVSRGGLIMVFGNSSGEATPIDLFTFAGGHEDARLQTYFSYCHEHEAGNRLRTLLRLVSRKQLQVDIGLSEDWTAIEDALHALAARQVTAKAVLTIS